MTSEDESGGEIDPYRQDGHSDGISAVVRLVLEKAHEVAS